MDVLLYSNGCPRCKQLKLMLEKNNISFIENNSLEEMIALGFKSVPMLKVGTVVMSFETAKHWIENYRKGVKNEE